MHQMRLGPRRCPKNVTCSPLGTAPFRCSPRARPVCQSTPTCTTASVRGGARQVPSGPSSAIVPLITSDQGLPMTVHFEYGTYLNALDTPCPSVPDYSVVEVLYVLSGHGALLETGSGVLHAIHPGASFITWADTTQLTQPTGSTSSSLTRAHAMGSTSQMHHTDSADGMQETEPLAVLKFFLPVELLKPGDVEHEFTDEQRQQLLACERLILGRCQAQATVLQDSTAVNLLSSAHASSKQILKAAHAHVQKQQSTHQENSRKRFMHGAVENMLKQHHELVTLVSSSILPAVQQVPNAAAHVSSMLAHTLSQGLLSIPQTVLNAGNSIKFRWVGTKAPVMVHHAPASRTADQGSSTPDVTINDHTALHTQDLLKDVQHQLDVSVHHQGHQTPHADVVMGHAQAASLSSLPTSQCVLLARAMEDFKAFQFPRQTNQLAFVFEPTELGLSLSFGVEVFNPGHHTPIHLHKTGYELFFILAGEGDAYCDGHHIPVKAGDCIVFPPGTKHGLDNNTQRKLYSLQLMCPDDEFVTFVQTGQSLGHLNDEDICALTANRC